MIESVTEQSATWAPVPEKFEAGTQDAAGIYALDAALTYMEEVGFDDFIYGSGVSVIEWADRIIELMPDHYTSIEMTRDDEKGFDHRHIRIVQI